MTPSPTSAPLKPIVLKFGGTSMKNHATWAQVLSIATAMADREDGAVVVVVSATSGTTRRLVESARLAMEGRLDDALSIVEEIRERHEGILRGFCEARGTASDAVDTVEAVDAVDAVEAVDTEEAVDAGMKALHVQLGHLTSLLASCNGIGDDHSDAPARMDAIAGIGEEISSRLLAVCAGLGPHGATGSPSAPSGGNPRRIAHVDSRKVVITDDRFGSARPDRHAIRSHAGLVRNVLDDGGMAIMGGYIGTTPDGRHTTLGFEGSDLTATLLGEALDASRVEIWTDVSGVHTSDPRRIATARSIRHLTFEQAALMAHAGASVLHPNTLDPVTHRRIPVWVKNLFQPDHPGTRIGDVAGTERESAASLDAADRPGPSALAITFPKPASDSLATIGLVGLDEQATSWVAAHLDHLQHLIGTSIPIQFEQKQKHVVHLTVLRDMVDVLANLLHRQFMDGGEDANMSGRPVGSDAGLSHDAPDLGPAAVSDGGGKPGYP